MKVEVGINEIFSENKCILCGKSAEVWGLWFPGDAKLGSRVLQYGLCFRHFLTAQQDKHFLRLIESVIEGWFNQE